MDKTQKSLEGIVCLRCGRPLTNEKSRQARLGPKCARKLVYETRTKFYSTKTLKCYKGALKSSSKETTIPTKAISLYYDPNSSKKPYCKVGTIALPAIDIKTENESYYGKRCFFVPLLENVVYQIFEPLPQPHFFWLQVQNEQLKDMDQDFEN